ncbi:hypothetical protein PMIN06_011565 [Paraphaeosphaeria minitans]
MLSQGSSTTSPFGNSSPSFVFASSSGGVSAPSRSSTLSFSSRTASPSSSIASGVSSSATTPVPNASQRSSTTASGASASFSPVQSVSTSVSSLLLSSNSGSTLPSETSTTGRTTTSSVQGSLTSASASSSSEITFVKPNPSSETSTSRPFPTPGVNNTEQVEPTASVMVTKVLAYADAEFSLIFPKPDIVTTQSYWTGTYPSITGADWTELPLTTRTLRQSPPSQLPYLTLLNPGGQQNSVSELPPLPSLSASVITSEVPSFELPKSSSRRLTTLQTVMVTTIIIDDVAAVTATATATQTGGRIAARATDDDEPGPRSCGESGNFTLTFDDSTVSGGDSDILPVSGMRNPYHHLFYANGFAYLADKWEPYAARSQPNVAIFLPVGSSLLPNSPFAGTLLPGEFGAGPRASVNAYWFNARSGYFGCALNGITPCTLRVSGYRYDEGVRGEVLVAEQNVTIPPCWGYINCQLSQVTFNEQFQGLSGIQFNAFTYKLGIPQIFMMDDLTMDWYNNSCSAGILRIGHS